MPKLVKTAKTNRVRSSTKRINDRKLNNDWDKSLEHWYTGSLSGAPGICIGQNKL
jgi:hypothetical protein